MRLIYTILGILISYGLTVGQQVKSPVVQNIDSSGPGASWNNIMNVNGSDNLYATSSIPPGQRTQLLEIATTLQMNNGEKLVGIEIFVERHLFQGDSMMDSVVFALEKKGTNQVLTPTPMVDQTVKIGSPTDSWKGNPTGPIWTSTLRYSAYNIGSMQAIVYVDDVRILVYYYVDSESHHDSGIDRYELAPFDNNYSKLELPCDGLAKIYNSHGRLIKEINLPNSWDGTDNTGSLVPAGEYIILSDKCDQIRVSVIK